MPGSLYQNACIFFKKVVKNVSFVKLVAFDLIQVLKNLTATSMESLFFTSISLHSQSLTVSIPHFLGGQTLKLLEGSYPTSTKTSRKDRSSLSQLKIICKSNAYKCNIRNKTVFCNSFCPDPAGWVSRPQPSCAEWSSPTGPAVFQAHCLASAHLDLDYLDLNVHQNCQTQSLTHQSQGRYGVLPDSESNSSKSGSLWGKQSPFPLLESIRISLTTSSLILRCLLALIIVKKGKTSSKSTKSVRN